MFKLTTDNLIIFIILLIYCVISFGIFIDRLIYYLRCLSDKKFRDKQPILWKTGCIRDMILSLTMTWLPILLIVTLVDVFE